MFRIGFMLVIMRNPDRASSRGTNVNTHDYTTNHHARICRVVKHQSLHDKPERLGIKV